MNVSRNRSSRFATRDPRDGRLLAARRQPVPPRAEERARENTVGDLGGLVLEATDLGQEHAALPLDLVVGEARLGGYLVEQREEAWPVSRQTPRTKLAVLLVGSALDAAPGVLGGARHLDGGSRSRPLEEHASEEGRQPVQLRRLVGRAAPGQEGHGNDRGAPVLAHQHRQAIGKDQARHQAEVREGGPDRRGAEPRLPPGARRPPGVADRRSLASPGSRGADDGSGEAVGPKMAPRGLAHGLARHAPDGIDVAQLELEGPHRVRRAQRVGGTFRRLAAEGVVRLHRRHRTGEFLLGDEILGQALHLRQDRSLDLRVARRRRPAVTAIIPASRRR